MTPFAQFRMWLREGPRSEHQLGIAVLVVVLTLGAWVVIPIDHGGSSGTLAATSSGQGAQGPATGSPVANHGSSPNGATPGVATPSGGAVTTEGPGATTAPGSATSGGAAAGDASSSQTTAGASGSACAPASSSTQGVTNSQITLGVDLVDIGALGSVIGLPSYGDQVKAFTAVFDSYNKSGGVQCRKLVAKFYRDNVTDTNSEQAVCLQMQQDKVFAALNNLYNAQTITCIAQAHIPNVWYTPPHLTQLQKYYPYILSIQPNYDRLIKDYILGANQRGWFAGATKIGILEQTCYPELNSDIAKALAAIAVPSNKIETFNFGCGSATTSDPFQEAQAVRQFSSDHVTHVLNVAYQQVIAFTTAAKNTNYHPKYAIMQDAEMNLMQASQMPPDPSFDGALGITTDQIGATYTPNVALSPSTAACAKTLASVGLGPPTAGGTTGALFGNACSTTALLVAALRRETQIAGDKLAAAIGTVGAFDFPYQTGPANFTDPSDPTGGQMWRPVTYSAPCTCFHVLNPGWQKGFA